MLKQRAGRDGRTGVATLLSLVIPVKDEAETITALIDSISDNLADVPYELIVVDDGSVDGTVRELEKGDKDILLVRHPTNLGKGAAMNTGTSMASGEIIVFLDGDGAHGPQDIHRLVAPILKGEADLVVGTRPKGTGFLRALCNSMASLTISMIVSFLVPLRSGRWPRKFIKITDCTSGFRAITREAWFALNIESQGFEIETEMTFEAVKRNLTIVEVPLTRGRNGHHSQLSIFRDGIKTLCLLARKLSQSETGVKSTIRRIPRPLTRFD